MPWAHDTEQQTSISAYEDTMPGCARTYWSTSQVVLISMSAISACICTECSPGTCLSLSRFSLSIPTLLAKSLCTESPSASLPFFQSQFPVFQLFTVDEEKKSFFYSSLLHHQKHKRPAVYFLGIINST